MLKCLYPEIDWTAVRAVGFDMDGTLYDEAEFIGQVYQPIAAIVAEAVHVPVGTLYEHLFCEWLAKGSSYGGIFSDTIRRFGGENFDQKMVITQCLAMFRGFQPVLALPKRVEAILNHLADQYSMFLVTDGSEQLQRAKFGALGLGRWLAQDNVGITGCFGPAYGKPATDILTHLPVLRGIRSAQVVFFGDREVDAQFASQAGFNFIKVASMVPIAHETKT